MILETFRCDHCSAETEQLTVDEPLPVYWLTLRPEEGEIRHLCSWECVLHIAATELDRIEAEARARES